MKSEVPGVVSGCRSFVRWVFPKLGMSMCNESLSLTNSIISIPTKDRLQILPPAHYLNGKITEEPNLLVFPYTLNYHWGFSNSKALFALTKDCSISHIQEFSKDESSACA